MEDVRALEALRDAEEVAALENQSALNKIKALRRSALSNTTRQWMMWTDHLLMKVDDAFKEHVKHPEDMGMNIPCAVVELRKYHQAVLQAITTEYKQDIRDKTPQGHHASAARERARLFLMPTGDSNESIPMPLLTATCAKAVLTALNTCKSGLLEVRKCHNCPTAYLCESAIGERQSKYADTHKCADRQLIIQLANCVTTSARPDVRSAD